jgi:hypothetical protein
VAQVNNHSAKESGSGSKNLGQRGLNQTLQKP